MSLFALVSPNYVLFSKFYENIQPNEGEKINIFIFFGKIFKIRDTKHSFAAYKKEGQKNVICLIWMESEGKNDLQIVNNPVIWLKFISK